MIGHLRGTIHKRQPGQIIVDVAGVGYLVAVPLDVWDELEEGAEELLHTSTFVREDRLELYGFRDATGRILFEEATGLPGVGPKLALELCAVPRSIIARAVQERDARMLTNIKGIGAKRAEKLLLELEGLCEKHPTLFMMETVSGKHAARYDNDAAAALQALGYDSGTIAAALRALPADLESTEERVSAALRSLGV